MRRLSSPIPDVASLAAVAAAQERTPPAAPGGLVLERIHNDFVVAPDFKVTDVDGRTGTLAGGTAFQNCARLV
jgi:hypothetical protein